MIQQKFYQFNGTIMNTFKKMVIFILILNYHLPTYKMNLEKRD